MAARPWLLALVLAASAHARLVPDDATPLGTRLPVVLIHGWCGDPTTWDALAPQARADAAFARRCKTYRFAYDSLRAIAESAATLAADLDARAELRGRPVALVGHSMGGLVARAYAEAPRLARVQAVYTLGTPHHGSPAANLEWLAGSSKYSTFLKLMPFGLSELLDKFARFKALRTEGGHNLGWDNYDQRMPPELWVGADRFVRGLNDRLAASGLADELLARYRCWASYRAQVPALSVLNLRRQLAAGKEYDAGSALLTHGLRDREGRGITAWAANDGIVPLDSALFLQPGPEVIAVQGDAVTVHAELVAQRQRRPGVGRWWLGPDHAELAGDRRVVQPLLAALAAEEPNLLALSVGGVLHLWRPGSEQSAPLGRLTGTPLAAGRPDRLLVRQLEGLAQVEPDRARLVGRGDGEWQVAPDGAAAFTPDGAWLGLDRPGYARVGAAPERVLWSPDGTLVAWSAGDAGFVTALERLRPVPLPGPPLAWSPDSQALVLETVGGPLAAAFAPDSQRAALLVAPGGGHVATVLRGAGLAPTDWALPATDGPGAGLAVGAAEDGKLTLWSNAAWAPVWTGEGGWLAWLEGAGRTSVALRRGEAETRYVDLPGPATSLTAGPGATLLGVVGGRAETLLGVIDAASGAWRVLGRSPVAPNSPPCLSPDGRYVALPLAQRLLVVATDGSGAWDLPGGSPVWLPLPAARRWLR